MPVDTALTWNEIRDFSAGLWNIDGSYGPPNGAQIMNDCYALPQGGLRSFVYASGMTVSGISGTTAGAITVQSVIGLHVHEHINNRSGSGISLGDFYLFTFKSSTTKVNLFRMDQSNGESVWTLITQFGVNQSPGVVPTCSYTLTDGTLYMAFNLGANGASGGLYTLAYSGTGATATLTQQSSTITGRPYNYQQRLICAGGGSTAGNGPRIYYSDAGVLTNLTTNFAVVDASEGQPTIIDFATFSPGDLLVFKEGAPIYLVEGDLDDFTVRQMNGSKPMRTAGHRNVVRGPGGVLWRADLDGIYETPDGNQLFPKSKGLSRTTFSDCSLSWLHHWLFDSNSGKIMDYDTGCWFNTTLVTIGGPSFSMPRAGLVWFADNATSFTLNFFRMDTDTSTHLSSYTWTSQPLRDPDGRQIEVRAVEIYCKNGNGSTGSVTVGVNNVTQTLACDSSGKGALTFYFRQRREYLDVSVTAASNASGVEAPVIEAVRIATRTGHFLRPTSDVG